MSIMETVEDLGYVAINVPICKICLTEIGDYTSIIRGVCEACNSESCNEGGI